MSSILACCGFGSRKQAVTRTKEINAYSSARQRRSAIKTAREEGRNYISSHESEDTAEANAGEGLPRVTFANDREEVRRPLCGGDGSRWNSTAGNWIYHNNPPHLVAPNFSYLIIAPPALIPLPHPIPGNAPSFNMANNAGVLYGAAAAAPQVSMAPRPLADTSTTTTAFMPPMVLVSSNHPEEEKKKRSTGRYYVWEEDRDSEGRFWFRDDTREFTREDPYV